MAQSTLTRDPNTGTYSFTNPSTAVINNVTGQTANTLSPAAVTSKPASNELLNIQGQHADITKGITDQATKAATTKATADAATQAKAQADAQAKIDQQKADAATAAAAAKTAAVGGTNQFFSYLLPNGQSVQIQDPTNNKDMLKGASFISGPGPDPLASTTTSTTAPALPDQTDRNALAKVQQDYQDQAKQVQDTISNIQNGTTPLSAGEQAQVDALKAQFQTLIDQQTLINTGASGTANIRGYQAGAAEYDPTFQTKTIGSIVSAGLNKLSALQGQMAAAVASLTQSFKDNDIAKVKDAWDIYEKASTAHQNALQKTIDDTKAAIASAQAEVDKQNQYNLDVAKFNQTGDKNAFDNAFNVEQEKETVRHNKVTEAIDAFKAGQGAGGGSGVSISQSSELTATGNPDPVSQKQVLDQITQQYGPMTAVAIKGLADYSMNPADWSTRIVKGGKGLTREQAVTLAKMYDPTYSDAQWAVRQTYLKNLASSQSGTIGSAVNAANKSINHLTAYVQTMRQLPNGWIEPLNAFGNAITFSPTVRQNLHAAQTEGLGVAEELAKFFKGSGTIDVASIEAWKAQLNTSASSASVRGLTQGAVTLLAGQLETLTEQYQRTMGKAPETDFLGTSARASLSQLKNQGYTVDIPGINYTDKNAYLKNDPDAQANMTAAIKALTSAGLPLTPENILQAAQNL